MSGEMVTWPRGFRAAGVCAGIKASGKADVALLVAEEPCVAAGAFTRNRVVGPAVTVSRERVRSGRARAIFINSGNANTCTGPRGLRDVETISNEMARAVGCSPAEVLICSTGIIGEYLPMRRVRAGVHDAAGALSDGADAGRDFARAILTTDLVTKVASETVRIGSTEVRVAGAAKGSGMIAPNMATMLAFVTTDAAVGAGPLRRAWREAVVSSFNRVDVDGHMSTSDTALVLASGKAGNRPVAGGAGYERLAGALTAVCESLARQIAADGEGATRQVTVRVKGAASVAEARKAARAITGSPLVRCAFFGADPNWGRIISAVGYSGAAFSWEALSCRVAGTLVFRGGRPVRFDEQRVRQWMGAKQWEVEVDLGVGEHEEWIHTCDMTHGYVSINSEYHT